MRTGLSHSSFPWYREKKKLFYRWIQRQRSATISQRQAFVTATGERVFIGSTFNCLKPGGFLHPVNVSVGTVIAVGLEETQHLKTRRLRPGDILEIFDGCGNVGHATLLEYVQGKTQRASLRVDSWCSNSSESEGHNSQCVTVGVSMPKGKRADWLVEKLTEVGVHCVIPLHFARSNIRADNDDANRYQRWMRIAVSACKQCGRSEVINIGQDQSFVELLSHQKNRPTWDIMFYSVKKCTSSKPNKLVVLSKSISNCRPEGGLTTEEEYQAKSTGAQFMSLNNYILRIETAALVSSSLLLSTANWKNAYPQ